MFLTEVITNAVTYCIEGEHPWPLAQLVLVPGDFWQHLTVDAGLLCELVTSNVVSKEWIILG